MSSTKNIKRKLLHCISDSDWEYPSDIFRKFKKDFSVYNMAWNEQRNILISMCHEGLLERRDVNSLAFKRIVPKITKPICPVAKD